MERGIILLTLIFILLSCGSREKTDIRIEARFKGAVDLSDIMNRPERLVLSNPDTVVVGAIKKIIADAGRFYLSDGMSIHVYTDEGVFLFKIDRRGRGPGEYFDIMDFCLCDNSIYIIDRSPKLLKYGLDGQPDSSVALDFPGYDLRIGRWLPVPVECISVGSGEVPYLQPPDIGTAVIFLPCRQGGDDLPSFSEPADLFPVWRHAAVP